MAIQQNCLSLQGWVQFSDWCQSRQLDRHLHWSYFTPALRQSDSTLAFNRYGGVCQVYWACLILLLSFQTALHSLWFVSSFGAWRMFSTGIVIQSVPLGQREGCARNLARKLILQKALLWQSNSWGTNTVREEPCFYGVDSTY